MYSKEYREAEIFYDQLRELVESGTHVVIGGLWAIYKDNDVYMSYDPDKHNDGDMIECSATLAEAFEKFLNEFDSTRIPPMNFWQRLKRKFHRADPRYHYASIDYLRGYVAGKKIQENFINTMRRENNG